MPAAHDTSKCFFSAGDEIVRAGLWWLQGKAYVILPQEHVCRVLDVLVDEHRRGFMACCYSWSQLVHVTAELLYEGGCFEPRGG